MRDFLSSIDWDGAGLIFGLILIFTIFIGLVIVLAFSAISLLVPLIGLGWTIVACVPVVIGLTLVFLELILRY